MPCSDSGWPSAPYPYEELDTLRKRNCLLGSMLCAICRKFEEGADFAVADIPNLVEWWEDHKKHDALIAELERYEKAGVPMTYEQREILREHRKYAV
jgi:hypothetical protein